MKSAVGSTIAVLLTLALGPAAAPGPLPAPAERPVPRTHAHNDYLHARPLFDALRHGFVGVEADVFLVGDELRVSHNRVADWAAVPTLEAAYLKPLGGLKSKHRNGGVYADGAGVLLLVDLKTDGVETYRRLHDVLTQFQAANAGLFTAYEKTPEGGWRVTRGAVDVVISGHLNPPRHVMAGQAVRYAGHDGRLADVGPDQSPDEGPEVVPLISDNWAKVFAGEFAWDGSGEIPDDTREKLARIVSDVHAEGKRLRFWNLPKDAPGVWGALLDAGVDLINTDDLAGLARYVRSRQKNR